MTATRPRPARLFAACVPAIPYVPATTILGSEMAKLASRDGEPGRVALVVDGAGSMHGVTHTIERIREHGVPGLGGRGGRHRLRASTAACPPSPRSRCPSTPGCRSGSRASRSSSQTLVDGRYDLVHLASPGPGRDRGGADRADRRNPAVGSYHTELAAYAGLRSGDPRLEQGMGTALSLFYGQCEVVLSPSPATDESLIAARDRGRSGSGAGRAASTSTSTTRQRRDPGAYPGEVKVLYAGRLTKEKGVDLLAESFLLARERDPRLHLLLAGGGPEEELLRVRLGEHATFLGWLDREELANAYASADVFLFCSRTDTYGQVIAEAQASGLPVVAVAEGGPATLIRDRQTGWLCEPNPEALAAAVAQLAESLVPARADRAAGARRGPRPDLGGSRSPSSPPATSARSAGRDASRSPRRCSEVA